VNDGRKAEQTRRRVMYNAEVLDHMQMIWQRMIDPTHEMPITHDGYLKQYQLSLPDLSGQYTTILLDEAQDTNPVTNHIVCQQKCKLVYTGDMHQQIYRFRGADNAMESPGVK